MKNRNLEHKDNWATPKEVYNKLDAEFHFDFDPCPLNEGIITPEKDGLKIKWGKSNFVNPPYSRKLKEAFIAKALEESKIGNLCVMLLPVSTSTKIFHEVIYPNAEIRFVKGRIAFEGVNTFGEKVGKGSAPMHDSMIVIFRGKSL
jgi:site-specific DNA-methyltransferase (adenine-specific)